MSAWAFKWQCLSLLRKNEGKDVLYYLVYYTQIECNSHGCCCHEHNKGQLTHYGALTLEPGIVERLVDKHLALGLSTWALLRVSMLCGLVGGGFGSPVSCQSE